MHVVIPISIVTLYSALVLHECKAEKLCSLPKPSVDVDWTKMSGNWYLILNGDDVMSRTAACYGYQNIEPTSNGARMHGVEYHSHGHVIEPIPYNIRRTGTGVYRNQKVLRHKVTEALKKDLLPLPKGIKEELDSFEQQETVYQSDYDNYLIVLYCGNKGEKYTLVFGRSPYPSAETLVKVYNKLIDLRNGWESVPLRLSGCRKLRQFDAFQD